MKDTGNPICPRCGYDLSGEVGRWSAECPLSGRCSECGLALAWADILSDRLRPPPWSFEHAPGFWWGRLPLAWRRSLRARLYWRELRLEHAVNVRRLLLTAALLLSLVYAVFGVSTALMLAFEDIYFMQRFQTLGSLPPSTTAPADTVLVVHAWETYRRFLFMPLVSIDFARGDVYRGPLVGAWVVTLAAGVASMPLGFLLLPETFRRVRVRRVHLLRLFVHTLAVPALLAAVATAAIAWAGGYDALRWGWPIAVSGLAYVWLAWFHGASAYLRLPRAVAIWAGLTTISVLCALIAATLLLPGEFFLY